MQISLKLSLVLLVEKVNFGEWVERQVHSQNETKNKNKRNPNNKPGTLQTF